ncbi:alpha/beta hydrolase [Mesorhizobium sp. ANAO-SY3R2]|uniref:alpha/beta hydrolase n=1 Tax=Mesorhizobium sp. ANAO-SY3R2 TaxID=3166644 RepID=UPI00367213E7
MNQSKPAAVFLDYDQARLDLNYNQGAWAPNADEIIAWYRTASLAAHDRLRCHNLAYGEAPLERIDLFPAREAGAPLVVYVHGGAWRSLDRMDSAYAAEAFVGAGINFAVLDFASIPNARLPAMVAQVRRSIGWLSRHAAEYGCNADRLFVVGHSSGAHLVAAALTSLCDDGEIAPNTVKGAICASGAYDLEGPMLSARGTYLQLSGEEVQAFGPMRHLSRIDCPMIVAYGDGETDEYRRHAKAFHAGLLDAGKVSELIVAEGQNHFEISTTLAQPDGILFRAAMGLVSRTR